MKKIFLAIFSLIFLSFSAFLPQIVNNLAQADTLEKKDDSYTSKTLNELNVSPLVAGPGESYFEDDVVYYLNTGNTIGYNVEHKDFLFDFDIAFNYFGSGNSWFSITVKASGCDRTQSPNLKQKGYSFLIWQSGAIQVTKGGEIASGNIGPIVLGKSYNFKIGAVNNGNLVNVVLIVDGIAVIDYTDESSPFLEGNWMNFCSDGGVTADIMSTKSTIYPDYYTYTLSTLGEYPMRAGAPLANVDGNNNIEILNGSNTVGFGQAIQNFSLEMKVNFAKFAFPSNFYISARVGGFDRAQGAGLMQKGYSFRFGAGGTLAIVKEGAQVGSVGIAPFEENRDYIFEVGIIDVNENKTNLFIAIDNKLVISTFDTVNPIQERGFININPDGDVHCTLTSSNTRLTPLQTKLTDEETQKIEVKFYNTFSFKELKYEDFSERNLQSILINGKSIKELNGLYYAKQNEEKINAILLAYSGNTLTITINKEIYSISSNEQVDFKFKSLTIKKNSTKSGLVSPSGFNLKQTYTYSI